MRLNLRLHFCSTFSTSYLSNRLCVPASISFASVPPLLRHSFSCSNGLWLPRSSQVGICRLHNPSHSPNFLIKKHGSSSSSSWIFLLPDLKISNRHNKTDHSKVKVLFNIRRHHISPRLRSPTCPQLRLLINNASVFRAPLHPLGSLA